MRSAGQPTECHVESGLLEKDYSIFNLNFVTVNSDMHLQSSLKMMMLYDAVCCMLCMLMNL